MNSQLQRMWIQLTADKRRFGVLLACVAVGLLMWARLIVISRPPQKAVAGDQQAKVSDDEGGGAAGAGVSDRTPRPPVHVVLPEDVNRDPFRISSRYFPKPTPLVVESREVVQLTGDSVEEEERAKALRTAQLREMASSLTLEAVLRGGLAVINGRTLMLGASFKVGRHEEVVFTLIEVGDRSVVVEAEGRHFELRMSLGIRNENN